MGWMDDKVSDKKLSDLVTEQAGGQPAWKQDSQVPMIDKALRYGRGLLDSAVNGITMGFGDEIGAATDAATQPVTGAIFGGSQAPNYSDRYEQNLRSERGRAHDFAKDNPIASTTSGITGSVMGAANLPKALYSGGGLLANTLKGALTGGTLGGVQGFGEGEGGAENRLRNAVPGAIGGATVGAVIPPAGAGLGQLYEKFAPPILNKIADMAERFVPKAPAKSGSAAAPEGGMVTQDSLATSLADTTRNTAAKVEDTAATSRLALEIARSGGVDKAKARLGDLGEGAFIADTSEGAKRLANVGFTLPGEAADKYKAAFGQRNKETGQRFIQTLEGDTKPPSAYEAQKYLAEYKTQTGREIYDPVLRTGEFRISPEMRDVMQKTPGVQEAMDQIMADAAKYNQNLTPAEVAHLIKQTMNKNTDAAFQSGKSVNKDMVRSAGDAWEKALWDANPGIKAADQEYAKVASLPDWLQKGRDFMRTGTSEAATEVSPSALAAELPGADAAQRQVFGVGATNTMRDSGMQGADATRRLAKTITQSQGMQEKLGEIFGPAKAESILRRSKAELDFADTAQNVTRGSQTAQRLASMGDDAALSMPSSSSPASILRIVADQYSRIRAPSEAVRSKLADILANPNSASNAEALSLVEEILKRQAGQRSVNSGVAGYAGGSFSSSP